MDKETLLNIAVACVMGSALDAATKRIVVDELRDMQRDAEITRTTNRILYGNCDGKKPNGLLSEFGNKGE